MSFENYFYREADSVIERRSAILKKQLSKNDLELLINTKAKEEEFHKILKNDLSFLRIVFRVRKKNIFV